MNKSSQIKLSYLKTKFQKFYEEIKNKHYDDRRLFQNIYEMLLESIAVMGTIDNNLIQVAFNKQYEEEMETLERIRNRFQNC